MLLSILLLLAQPMPANVTPAALLADERERDARERLPQLVKALRIGKGSVVADVGTGYGYYAVRFSPVVGVTGRVYATEIDPPLLARLRKRLVAEKLANVIPVPTTPAHPGLPAGQLDAVLVADVFHEVDEPVVWLRRIRSSLKAGGRLVILDYSKPASRSAPRARQRHEHNLAPALAESDLQAAGFVVVERQDPLGPGYDGVPTYYIVAIH